MKILFLSIAATMILGFNNCSSESQINEVVKVEVDTTIKKPLAEEKEEEIFNFEELGKASYYGPGFHGRLTASGEMFDQNAMTAAHKMLPFGTQVKVTNEATGKSIYVTINDRGPYIHNRIIDLSVKAAQELNITNAGVANVRIEALIESDKAKGIANKIERVKENSYMYN